jgi:hypothetical protein
LSVERKRELLRGISSINNQRCSINAVLSYGLIHPDHHGKGLGTALLLARLAMIPTELFPLVVGLSAVPTSQGYYERFGFVQYGQSEIKGMPLAEIGAIFTKELRAECVTMLKEAGVVLPEGLEIRAEDVEVVAEAANAAAAQR